jgi:hypothetical protein
MRFLKSALLLFVSSLLLGMAFLMPAHMRAVDRVVLQAGSREPGLISEAFSMISLEKPGPAAFLHDLCQQDGQKGVGKLKSALEAFRENEPSRFLQGDSDPLIGGWMGRHAPSGETVVAWMISVPFRDEVIGYLEDSNRPGVAGLLNKRHLEPLSNFPPVDYPGREVFDAVLLLTALLYEEDHLNSGFRKDLDTICSNVQNGQQTDHLESVMLRMLAIAKRMNWGQLSAFMHKIDSTQSLISLVDIASRSENALTVVYGAVWFSNSTTELADYLRLYPKTGLVDIEETVQQGQSALRHLLERRQRVFTSPTRESLYAWTWLVSPTGHLAKFTLHWPLGALFFKYTFLLLGLFLLVRFVQHESDLATKRGDVARLRFLRHQIVTILIFVLIIGAGEPFLAQDSKKKESDMRWNFPSMGTATTEQVETFMETKITQITLLALAIFALIQLSIYALCLIKLNEIRKHDARSRLKLKLLDNEENMFDSGLYFGLGGTVLSLVMLALGIVKPGLMAAYASTLFGIIFVAVLKIFHVRPYRKELILKSENETA